MSKKIHFSTCAADPEQKIKAPEAQLREANEKVQLFEAVLDVLKKGSGVRVVKSLWASSRAKASLGAERVEGPQSSVLAIVRFDPHRARGPRIPDKRLLVRF